MGICFSSNSNSICSTTGCLSQYEADYTFLSDTTSSNTNTGIGSWETKEIYKSYM